MSSHVSELLARPDAFLWLNPEVGILVGICGGIVACCVMIGLCVVSDRRHDARVAIERAARDEEFRRAWDSFHDPLLREAEREVDELIPACPISTPFMGRVDLAREEFLAGLVPPDAESAEVYPDPFRGRGDLAPPTELAVAIPPRPTVMQPTARPGDSATPGGGGQSRPTPGAGR